MKKNFAHLTIAPVSNNKGHFTPSAAEEAKPVGPTLNQMSVARTRALELLVQEFPQAPRVTLRDYVEDAQIEVCRRYRKTEAGLSVKLLVGTAEINLGKKDLFPEVAAYDTPPAELHPTVEEFPRFRY